MFKRSNIFFRKDSDVKLHVLLCLRFTFPSTMTSAAEKHARANTLSCVIGLCIGKVTTVELRNESHVTGRVVEVSTSKRFS